MNKNISIGALILGSSLALGQTSPNPKAPPVTPPTLTKEEMLELDLFNTKAALITEQAQGQLGQLKVRMSQLREQISNEHPGFILTQQGTLTPAPIPNKPLPKIVAPTSTQNSNPKGK